MMSGWQDIESAPRDGTDVLCWAEGCGMEILKTYGVEMDDGRLWWSNSDGISHNWPTHWMPLPDPPEQVKK